jgi:hypothetical protein
MSLVEIQCHVGEEASGSAGGSSGIVGVLRGGVVGGIVFGVVGGGSLEDGGGFGCVGHEMFVFTEGIKLLNGSLPF